MKQLILLILAVSILGGCSQESYTRIDKNQPFLATVNLKDTSLTFLNNKYQVMGSWDLKIPFTGGLLLKDKDTLLLYGKDMTSISVFSLSKGHQIDSWNVSKGIVNMKLLQDGKSIVAVNQLLNTVFFYNDKGQLQNQVKVGKSPLTILQGNNRLYVLNFGDTKLSIINVKTRKVEQQFPIRISSTGALLRESKKELWIGGHGKGAQIEENVHIYSTETGKLKRTLKAPSMPINLIESHEGIFILSHGTNTLYKIKDDKILKSMTVGVNPFEMIHFQNDLLIAGYDSNALYIINPKNLTMKKKVSVGKGPFQLIRRE